MRTRPGIALVVTILLAAPAGAAAQQRGGDEQVRQEAAALPERMWQPGPDPVSAAGPGLPEEGAGGVRPIVTVLLLLGALAAGYAVSLRRTSRVSEAAAPVSVAAPAADPVPEPRPEPVAPAPLPDLHDADAAAETCAIALSHGWGRGQFEVRVKDRGGVNRVVARSLAFDVPRGMVIEQTGPAGRAHRRLMLHLIAAGWQPEPPGDGPWYERRLTRPLQEPGARDVDRGLVATRPQGGEAEFVALALDEYGNAQIMARSPRFSRRAGRPVEETEPAVTAHGSLLEDLEAHGWRVSGTLESWYGATIARRRRR
jgi:hypothetical protein